jgi:hypothetical protein
MSTIYNPEADTIAQIERLELEARDIRRRIEHARNAEDKRVLNRSSRKSRGRSTSSAARLP